MSIALSLYPLPALALTASIFVFVLLIKTEPADFFYFFLIIFPLIPAHSGINLGHSLPVLKFQRILYLMLILCWLSKKSVANIIRSAFSFPLTKLIPLFFIIFGYSYISQNNLKGFLFKTGTFTIENFAMSLIVFDIFKNSDEKNIKKVFLFLSLATIAPFIFGLVEHFFKFNPFIYLKPFHRQLSEVSQIQFRLGIGRVKGAFIHPIIYGLFFSFSIPGGMVYLIDKINETKRKKYFIYIYTFLFITIIGVLLSLSRLALFAYIINAFSFLFLFKPQIGISIFITFLAALIPSLNITNPKNKIIVFLQNLLSKQPENEEMYKSSVTRIRQIERFLPEVKKKLLFGSGGHTGIEKTGVIDNYYLRESLNSGILGLLSILLFFILPFISANIRFFSLKRKSLFEKLICLSVIVSIFSTFFVFAFLTLTDYLYIIWIYIGMFYAVKHKYRNT